MTPPGRCSPSGRPPFDQTFVMRRATGARWLNVAVLPPGAGD